MPYIPRPKKIKTGSSSIDALISFLGGDDDPAQSLMDTVNPAVGMARKGARKLADRILKGKPQDVSYISGAKDEIKFLDPETGSSMTIITTSAVPKK